MPAEVKDLSYYEENVRRMLILNFMNSHFSRMSADTFVERLHRMFQRKKKVISNIAVYLKKEVEDFGRPMDKVLASLGFYATVLNDFEHKNLNQPMKR